MLEPLSGSTFKLKLHIFITNLSADAAVRHLLWIVSGQKRAVNVSVRIYRGGS